MNRELVELWLPLAVWLVWAVAMVSVGVYALSPPTLNSGFCSLNSGQSVLAPASIGGSLLRPHSSVFTPHSSVKTIGAVALGWGLWERYSSTATPALCMVAAA